MCYLFCSLLSFVTSLVVLMRDHSMKLRLNGVLSILWKISEFFPISHEKTLAYPIIFVP